jgi:hypothetical protein
MNTTHPTSSRNENTRMPFDEAVRTTLVELLTLGQHHYAATPRTLTLIGNARRNLAQHYGAAHNPAGLCATDHERLTALGTGMGDLATTLHINPPPYSPDPTELRASLSFLAAVALGWLDTLPSPPQSFPTPQDTSPAPDQSHIDEDDDAHPF